MICVCRVKNSGKVEFDIHRKLDDFKVQFSYENAGITTTATEVFKTDLVTLWQAYQTVVDWRNVPNKSKNRVSNFGVFDFKH